MKKEKNQKSKKVKTRGTVWIPPGIRDVLMGSSKEPPAKK